MSGKWLLWTSLALVACTAVESKDGYRELSQKGGPTLTYVDVPLLREGGKVFKDLSRNGELDPYENWRLTPEERAADLAAKLPPEYLSGLMTIFCLFLGFRLYGVIGVVFAVPLGMVLMEIKQYGVFNPALGVLKEMARSVADFLKKPGGYGPPDPALSEEKAEDKTEDALPKEAK